MKEKTCCFAGYKKIPFGEYEGIAERLRDEIIKLIERGCIRFIASASPGFDILAAQIVVELKKQYPKINLILVLLCKEQPERWMKEDIKRFNEILEKTDKVVYTSEQYDSWCMYRRNIYMIDNSSFFIIYYNEGAEDFGIVDYTVDYARKNGLKIKFFCLCPK